MVSASTILLEYVCPLMGVIMAWLVALAPYYDLQKAVKRGYLGDLNPTPWAFLFGSKFGWTTYAVVSQNLWVFIADCPGVLMSVYLNMGAIKLLYQGHHSNEMRKSLAAYMDGEQSKETSTAKDSHNEEGDESQLEASSAEDEKEIHLTIRSTAKDWATILWNISTKTTPAPAPHDHLFLGVIVTWTACVAFVCFATRLSSDTLTMFVGIVANLSLVVFSAAPLSTIYSVLSTRTSNSIHLPSLALNTLNSIFWLTYGLTIEDLYISVPYAVGTMLFAIQVVLCLLFPRTQEALPGGSNPSNDSALVMVEPPTDDPVDPTVRDKALPSELELSCSTSSIKDIDNGEEEVSSGSSSPEESPAVMCDVP